MGHIQHPSDERPPIGTKVIYSAFPDVVAADGIVVEGGIRCTDVFKLAEFERDNVCDVCLWENVESYVIVEKEGT